MCALGTRSFGGHIGWHTPSAIIAERNIDDENFGGARRPDRRAPDLDATRHKNMRPIL